MPIQTTLGRRNLNGVLAGQQWLVGLGAGSDTWADPPPAESAAATGLMAPLIYGALGMPQRVTLFPGGDIRIADSDYIQSPEGNQLYFEWRLNAGDLQGKTIREQGLFLAPEVSAANAGRRLLTPDQVDDPGILVILEHLRPAVIRSPGTVRTFQALVEF